MRKSLAIIALALCASTMFAEQSKTYGKAPTEAVNLTTEIALTSTDIVSPMVLSVTEVNDILFATAQISADGYCLSKASQITFGLRNGRQVIVNHINGNYCDVGAKFVFKLSPESINSLSESPISFIYFKADEDFYNLRKITDKDFFVRNFKIRKNNSG